MLSRTRLAYLVAPPVAVLAYTTQLAFVAAFASGETWAEPLAGIPDALFYFSFVGAPVAYTATLAVGVPGTRWLADSHRLRPAWVLGLGATAGALIGLLLQFGWGVASPSEALLGLRVGTVSGLAASSVFWLIAFRPRSAA